tara:strand:- start:8 stop:226 length:219 start_codon:yes stop_codon:yes gene_type:complete
MSTKNSFMSGKDFYVFTEMFEEEKGIFIKFFNPKDVKLMTDNGKVIEIEICISREVWKELSNKIKQNKDCKI